jgi:uncharacterized protein
MNLKERVNADVKQALLAGDKKRVVVLRGLKSVILNEEVAKSKRDEGLSDEVIVSLFQKEVKKRKEAIELYRNANEEERAHQEEYEVTIISEYLPEMLSEDKLRAVIDEVVAELGEVNMSKMGQVIGEVKKRTQGRADGAMTARLVKGELA